MRLSVATLGTMPAVVLGMLAVMPAVAQTSFPYKAYISGKDVYVRSGPGEQYYPTEKLHAGAEVDVYRQDPGGWLAIRPLPTSYSWVLGRYLKPSADGLARVTAQRVAARVGSQFSDIREVVQVHLDRGELVELKGTKEFGTGQSPGTWYRIAPPRGEFRWVHEKYVGDGGREVGGGGREVGGERNSSSIPNPQSPVSDPSSTGLRATGLQVPAASKRQLSPEGFQAELDDINTEASIMLAEESTVWDCAELRHRCETLLAQAETALERGRARALVNRLAQAEDIKRRFENVAERERGAGNESGPPLALSQRERGPAFADGTARRSTPSQGGIGRADDRYDGMGRLARVTPSKMGAPRYALLDDHGDVLYYVSPAPGVNMQYYVGREVGITGQQGHIADGGATHIMAKHVTALDSQLR